jgi:hypothetical protein
MSYIHSCELVFAYESNVTYAALSSVRRLYLGRERWERLVGLLPILLQLLFELLRFAVANFNRTDGRRIRLLELDRTVSNIFA